MREIFVLDVVKHPNNSIELSGVFWLASPPSYTRPNPNFSSIVPASTVASWGITQIEASAIQAGLFVEQSWNSGQLPGGLTVNQIENGLVGAYGSAQAALNNLYPAAKYIGAYYTGSAWILPS